MKTSTTLDVIRYIVNYMRTKLNLETVENNLNKISDLVKYFNETVSIWNRREDSKNLVIFIDAVDQLFDDEDRNNLRFIPTNLSGKVKIIFSCLSTFKTPLNITELTIPLLDKNSKRDIIQGILKVTRKQLGSSVISAICDREFSNSPLYLSLLIQRLEMMKQTDFERINAKAEFLRSIGNLNPEMKAINEVQIEILNECSGNLEEFCAYLVDIASANFGGDLIRKSVDYIAISRYGLKESDLEKIFATQNLKWNTLNFAIFTNYLSNFFIQREDGRIDFAHKNIRSGCKYRVHDEKKLHNEILKALKNLEFNDSIRQQEIVYHCVKSDDKNFFVKYVYELENQNIDDKEKSSTRNKAVSALNYTALEDNGNWIQYVLQHIKIVERQEQKNNSGIIAKLFDYIKNKIFSDKFAETDKEKYIYCAIDEMASVLKFFSAIDYSLIRTTKELNIGEENQQDIVDIARDFIFNNPTDNYKRLLADCYYNLGNVYFQLSQVGDQYNALAIENFKEAGELYEGVLEENNSIEIKKMLIKVHGKIIGAHFCAGHNLSLEIQHSIDIAINLANEIVNEQENAENVYLLSYILAISNFMSISGDFWKGRISEENYEINPHIIDSLEKMLDKLENIDKNHSNFEIEKSRKFIYKILYMINKSKPNLCLEYSIKELEIVNRNQHNYELRDFQSSLADIYFDIASMYSKLNDCENAIAYALKAIDIREKLFSLSELKEDIQCSISYLNFGILLSEHKREYKEGRKYIEKALAMIPDYVSPTIFYCSLIKICDMELKEIGEKFETTSDDEELKNLNAKFEEINKLLGDYQQQFFEVSGYTDTQEFLDKSEDFHSIFLNKKI